MEKAEKNKLYSLLILIIVSIICYSFPFTIFNISNNISLLLSSIMRIVALVFGYFYVKNNTLVVNEKEKNLNKSYLFIVFFIGCGSNFFLLFDKNTSVINNPNYLYIINLTLYYLLVALTEEFVFRKVMINYLENNNFSKLKIIICSAGCFSLVHLLNFSFNNPVGCLIQCVYCFGLGLILGLLYCFSHSFILVVLYHFLFNFLNDGLFELFVNNVETTTYYISNVIVAIILLLYGLLIYKLLTNERKNYES